MRNFTLYPDPDRPTADVITEDGELRVAVSQQMVDYYRQDGFYCGMLTYLDLEVVFITERYDCPVHGRP
jgi:hypothetical protein